MKVTYRPIEPTDPAFIEWNNIRFDANVPVDLDAANKAHGYMIPMPIERIIDGEVRTLHKEKWVPMIELAKGNPAFEVGEPAASAPPRKGRPPAPKTPEEYRAHAQRWIVAITDPDDLATRWGSEQELREKCGCGEDDVAWLNQFYEQRHQMLTALAA